MNRRTISFLAVIAFLCVGGTASLLFAEIQRISGPDDALAGLTTLQPRIRYYEDGSLRETNPATLQLQYDVERILTDAGIRLVGKEEFERLAASRSYPIGLLDIEVRMSPPREMDVRTYILSIKVRQAVFLARKPVVRFLAPSWESLDFGDAKDLSFVRAVAKDALERLVQDLQAQNPK